MNDDIHKTVQNLLKNIFDNVNNWLTHAEAKNAAIVAFNIACLSFIGGMKDIENVKILYCVHYYVTIYHYGFNFLFS